VSREAPVIETPVVEQQPVAPAADTQLQQPTAPSHADRVEALRQKGGADYQKYRMTGELPAEQPTAEAEPATENAGTDQTVQTEAASAPAATEQSKTKQTRDRDWNAVKAQLAEKDRELIAAKAKLEVFERQSAVSRPSAPTATETQPQADVPADERPEFPDINAFDDPAKFNEAVKAWKKADTAWVSGGSAAFRKSIWMELGGMDERFNPFYWEDIDLSYRAKEKGYTVLFEKKSVVHHFHEEGKIRQEFTKKQVEDIAFRNQFYFIWKHAPLSQFCLSIIWTPIRIVKEMIKGNWEMFRGLFFALPRLPELLLGRIL